MTPNDKYIDWKIALLIDGDNAQPSLLEHIIREAEKEGIATIRKIYGDWTTPQMNGWKNEIHKFAVQPIQQFRYTAGKNNTDSALIIDAMDILHQKIVDGFAIVSSDSDYTRLATRIRESGLFIMGIGEKKTPEAFVKACVKFVYTENIIPQTEEETEKILKKSQKGITKAEIINMITTAYDMSVKDGELVYLANIGLALRKIEPGFDTRTYGYKKLIDMIDAYPENFVLMVNEDSNQPVYYMKLKG